MTDLVLINPRIIGKDKYPPISLLCLAAYIREKGYSAAIIDAQAEQLSDNQVTERVVNYNPVLCGITFMTNQIPFVKKLLAKLHNSTLKTLFVAGGMHVSLLPQESEQLGFDYCVVGEGEKTLEELLNAVKNKEATDHIEGLWNKHNFKLRKLIENLDTLPLPAWDLVPIHEYSVSQPDLRYTFESGVCLSIASSRGCLFHCTFCSSHGVYGHSHRERSASHIVDEIEMLNKKYGVTKFFIVDESILANAKRAEQFAEELKRRNLKILFASSARVNDPGVNTQTLKKLHEAGMVRVDFGVESGSQKILNNIRKATTVKQIVKAHKLAHACGLKITSLMISGHLEETWEDVFDSLELMAEIPTDYPEFGSMTPYPGTQVCEKALREGWIRNFDWGMYYISNPYRVMRTRYFNYQEVYLLALLCGDVSHFMVEWKRHKPCSWREFYSILGTGNGRLKPEGLFWVAKYMLTRNRGYLRRLNLKQMKWSRRVFQNPEDAMLLRGIRTNPFCLFKKPRKKRLIRLLIPLLLNRIKEFIFIPIQQCFYAYKLMKQK